MPPAALWPCLGDLHELSFPAAWRRRQPGQKAASALSLLGSAKGGGAVEGGGGPPSHQTSSLVPQLGRPWGVLRQTSLGQVVPGWGTLVRPVPVAAALLSCH